MKWYMWFSLALIGLHVQAQVPQWEMEISGAAAFPRGDMEEFLDDDGFGIGLRFARRLGASPFVAGVDFHGLRLESDSFDYNFFPDFFDEANELEITSDLYMAHASLRIQRPVGYVRPYVEGLVGIKHFDTKIRWFYEDDDEFDEPIDTETVSDDSALSYGAGVGLDIQLKRYGNGPGISLRAGCRYLYGEEATYVVDDSVDFDGFVVEFDTVETKTDLFMVDLGITLRF